MLYSRRVSKRDKGVAPKNSLTSLAEPRSASFDRVGPSAAIMCLSASAPSSLDALPLSTKQQRPILTQLARDNNILFVSAKS